MRTVKMLAALFLAAATPAAAPAQQLDLFSVGSGDLSGVYFSVARAVCRAFNARGRSDLRCSPEPTNGSVYNLVMLRERELDFALTQSDWQRAAHEGHGPFATDGPAPWLRSVASLYSEPITVVARGDAGFRSTADLAGRRVDIGQYASGRNPTVRAMLARMELDTSYFGVVTTHDPRRAIAELCTGRIDAAIFVVGHPNALVAEAVDGCGATLLPFVGPNVTRLARQHPDYSTVVIPQVYEGQAAPVSTLAVHATLVTRADVDPNVVEGVVKALQEVREDLSSTVPQLTRSALPATATEGLVAPLHEGAALRTDR
ncbi:MAG: TAXI family TRAP transporter solute-binding subunit [Paracoccaceae bacterium]